MPYSVTKVTPLPQLYLHTIIPHILKQPHRKHPVPLPPFRNPCPFNPIQKRCRTLNKTQGNLMFIEVKQEETIVSQEECQMANASCSSRLLCTCGYTCDRSRFLLNRWPYVGVLTVLNKFNQYKKKKTCFSSSDIY